MSVSEALSDQPFHQQLAFTPQPEVEAVTKGLCVGAWGERQQKKLNKKYWTSRKPVRSLSIKDTAFPNPGFRPLSRMQEFQGFPLSHELITLAGQ